MGRFGALARLRGQCWPAFLAGGGRSEHLAGARSARSKPSSRTERSGRCREKIQRAAPMRSCFLRPTGRRAARGAPPPRPTQRCPSAYPMRSAAPPGRPDTSSDASCIIVQASTSWAGGQHGRMSATGLLFRSRSARFLVSSVHRTRTARAQPQVERWRSSKRSEA